MPQLPNRDRAVLDLRKLERYCLDPSHPRGRFKARVFRNSLGIARADAGWLRTALLSGVRGADAIPMTTDDFGTRWRVDVPLARQAKTAVVRTIRIQKGADDAPRFLTCWVL